MAAATTLDLPTFTIEADHPRNSDLLLQSIPNCRLRSAISSSRTVHDRKNNTDVTPTDQSIGLGGLPRIPGQRLTVNPSTGEYTITDPLCDEPDLCERIKNQFPKQFSSKTNLRGTPPVSGNLDEHSTKTLLRECRNLVDAKEATIRKGSLPKKDVIDEMSGRYLLNPGSRTMNTQPRFEDQWDDWFLQLQRNGG